MLFNITFLQLITNSASHSEIIMTSNSNDNLWTAICDDKIFERINSACSVYKDRYIVVAGGSGLRGNKIQSAAMYDVTNQLYVSLPNSPIADSGHCRGVVMNDYFYVIFDDLYRICLSKRLEWELVVHQKADGYFTDVMTDGNHIFLIDGHSQIAIFDPINNKLLPIIEIPHEMRGTFPSETVMMDNKLYIMHYEKMFIFDIVNRSWSPSSSYPEPIHGLAAVAIGRWIVVTGHGYTFVYDTRTQVWTQVNTAELSYHFRHESVKVGSHIITVGGVLYPFFEFSPITVIRIKHVIPEFTWIILKPYILLRQLIGENRAAPIIANVNKPKHNDSHLNTDTKVIADAVVEKLFTIMPLDIFRYTLMFLK